MNSLKDHYLNVHANINQLYREIPERRNRFHAFLLEHDPKGFVSFDLKALSQTPASREYSLEIEASSFDELRFSATVYDWGDSSDTYFYMPVDYLDDPQAWETAVLLKPIEDQELAVKIVKEIFGSYSVVITEIESSRPSTDEYGGISSERFLDIFINTDEDSIISGNGRASEFLKRNSLACYDRVTGILHLGQYNHNLSSDSVSIDEDRVIGRFNMV